MNIYTDIDYDDNFANECKQTFIISKEIEKWLKGAGTSSIIPIVNCMGINLKIPEELTKLNSSVLVSPRGTSKTELLERILAKSNPNHFIVLPTKFFESNLAKLRSEDFNNKILIQSDIISVFEGLNVKQRQQMTNFWSALIEGKYERADQSTKNKIENVRCIALFGLASEKYHVFREELLSSTFFDRIVPYKIEISNEQKREILNFRKDNNPIQNRNFKRPIIVLPLPKKITEKTKVKIEFPKLETIENNIIEFAMQLDTHQIQSCARAQDYIKIFMMCNALLNKRKTITENDLKLYSLVHPYFINATEGLTFKDVILNSFIKNPLIQDKDRIAELNLNKKTFYKYKKILIEEDKLKIKRIQEKNENVLEVD